MKESRLAEWPEHFPDSCPPADASPAEGFFYRIVDAAPPQDDDFLSNLRLFQLGKRFKRGKNWTDDCQAAGLSVLADRDEAINLRDSCGPMRRKAIAHGDTTGIGLMKHTPGRAGASHHTWWLPEGEKPASDFEVVV
ncbi:hypothetical protein [Gordonia sp. NPDC003585]|uniref:hypothetical protein n=1 Tax=Gordonia sp. NPDC003585 TaxID=3154275 RepID=UPI0033A8B17F